MVLPDYPIEGEAGDELRRAPLARRVADLIASYEGEQSFVIGVEGPWGAGKTSFINLIRHELKGNDELLFVPFNPWNFTDQSALVTDFFGSIAAALKSDGGHDELVKKVSSYASRFQVRVSPSVTLFGASVSFGEVLKSGGMTLQQKRDEVDAYLRGSTKNVLVPVDENDKQLPSFDKKIVVVIDDTDRLDPAETLLVMKLIKMTGNFPNTIFVLAYDRARVAQRLTSNEWPGEEYLKKIIQVSFTLPLPDEQGMEKILFRHLDETLSDVYGDTKLSGEDEKRWGELSFAGFRELFKTVRDIKRYISSLRLTWSMVGKYEVNKVDFMVMEALRVLVPDFHAAMYANAEVFTGVPTSLLRDTDDKALEARFKELLLLHVPQEDRLVVEKVCGVLFPNRARGGGYGGGEWQQEWRRQLRVCASERFHVYFQLNIPEGGVSEVEVNTLLGILKEEEGLDAVMRELSKTKRLRPMLKKLQDKVETFDKQMARRLISTLWDLEKEIGDEQSAALDFDDTRIQVSRLAYHSIKNGVPAGERLAFLEELVKGTRSLYSPLYFLSIISDQGKEGSSGVEPPLLTKEETVELRKLGATRIREAAEDRTLEVEEELLFALYRWKEWEGEEVVRDYVEQLVSTRSGLLTFLRSFVGRVFSSTGNYNRLDKDGIIPLYSLEKIEKLVAEIKDNELDALDPASKEAVQLFRKPRRTGWRAGEDDF